MDARFACQSEENELREIFLYYDMDLAGEAEEHIVVKKDGEIIAGGKLSFVDRDSYHLEVLGVRSDQRCTGAGGLLLSHLLNRPWEFCLGAELAASQAYKISTVSRGDAVPFYQKHGFVECSFDELAYPYNEQCETCPDQEKCKPVPMFFVGGEIV